MKNALTLPHKIKLIAAAAFFAAGTLFQPAQALAQKAAQEVSNPAPGLMATVYEVEPMKVRLHLANPEGTTVAISIRNDQGQFVYRDAFKAIAYSSVLDLGSLPAGSYTLQVGGLSRSFSVGSTQDRVTVAQPLEQSPGTGLAAAMHEVAPQKVKVHLANPSGQNVKLEVRNEKNQVVLQKTLKGEQVAQILDLSGLSDGAYTVQAANNSGKVSRTFALSTISGRTFAWEGSATPLTASAPTK